MKWLKSQYRILRGELRSLVAMDREVMEDAVAVDIVRILWTAPIISASHFLAALGFWFQEPPAAPIEIRWLKWVTGINFVIAAVNILIGLVAWLIRKKESSRQTQSMLLYFVIVYVLLAGLFISVIDQLVIPSISPLIISVVIVATFYYIPPKNSFLIFTAFLLCFRFIFTTFTYDSGNILSSNLTNGFVACVVGFSLSVVNWQHFRKLKIQQNTITKQQEQLEQMAYQDSLTGLHNRRWLDELMKVEVALVKRKKVESCLVMLDIDDFKIINDTYGHPAGDVLLRNFAQLLQKTVRDSSTLVRIGGEEFIILSRSMSEGQCAVLVERIRTKIAEHVFQVDHHSIQVTASFGIAALQGTEGAEDYYLSADRALYRAKEAGKNRVMVFDGN